MEIVDVHTHCFPDFLAEKAIQSLIKNTGHVGSLACHDGTLRGLGQSMEKAGITKSVIASIATKPDQVESILEWSLSIKSEKFEPFISIHQDFKNFQSLLKTARENGIRGVKVHPHYQGFMVDDEKLFPLYEEFMRHGFIVLFHSGQDFAFPHTDNASVFRMKKVIEKFSDMKVILAHYGSYQEWDDVSKELAGTDVYFETSFALAEAGEDVFINILQKHSDDKILFGTDSPWMDQSDDVARIKKLGISNELKEKIFYKNYYKLIEGS